MISFKISKFFFIYYFSFFLIVSFFSIGFIFQHDFSNKSILFFSKENYFLFVFLSLSLFFFRSPLWIWSLFLAFLTYSKFFPVLNNFLNFNFESAYILGFFILFLFFLLSLLILRLALSFIFYKNLLFFKKVPKISKTEREALSVEQTWIEKNFLTGRLKMKDLLSQKFPVLSKREKDFLDQEIEELCFISSEWDFLKKKKLNSKQEDMLKKHKIFGLNIPEKEGGLAFSPFASAKVVEKVASHNIPLSILTMVPNSLGPAKLLLKYGTQFQKEKYLKDLASAKIWPCFALTEAQAGSDASSIESSAVLFKDKEELKLRLNFDKRWITLSAKADLIALAVQLKDPEHLLSDKVDLGITLVLVPSHLKGIQKGYYHNPMDIPIYNAPIKGENVVVPAKLSILGGLENAGKGWKMLLESLSSGRAISLPSLATAFSKRCSYLVGTYSLIRRQFGRPIAQFEGIQDSLAFIFGITHLMKATHTFTLSSLNQGIVSPVVSALTKYQLTDLGQRVVKRGMSVMGGAGLSLGPRNKIATLYKVLPLGITVEGSNILTRTFITYGQGLIKLHPQAYFLIQSLENKNFLQFHKNIIVFLYHFICHFIRFFTFFTLNLTLSFLGFFYFKGKTLLSFLTKNSLDSYDFFYEFLVIQKLRWSSVLFSLLSDLNLIVLGDRIKTKGQLSGRFADWLSGQYMISALIWYHRHKKTDLVLMEWCLQYCLFENQKIGEAVLRNYPHWIRLFLKPFIWALKIMPLGSGISDSLGKKLAKRFLNPSFKKDLCDNMYHSKDKEDYFYKINKAYELSLKEQEILKKEILSKEDKDILEKASQARYEAIQVDAFSKEEYFS
ncbi:MAG: acyl-CoA dehydrogenase [Bdellovibrionales bacterium]|nr:acyl-CoA dehydrogenase [Bdellovibrionales bacterium]